MTEPVTTTPDPRPTWSPERRILVIGVAAVVLLLVGVVVALAGSDDESVDTADLAAASTTTTTSSTTSFGAGDGTDLDAATTTIAGSVIDPGDASAPAAGATTTMAGGATSAPTPTTTATTASGGQGTNPAAATTTTTAAQGLGTPQDPGAPVPPQPGRYRYRVEGRGTEEGQSEGVTTVTDQARQADVVRQTVQIQGQGVDSTSTVEWRPDRVLVLESKFSFGGNTGDCDWTPDYLQAQFPLAAGATWNADSSCQVDGFGVPVTVRRVTSSQVTGLERRRMAGQVLDVWVIESQDMITFATTEVRTTVTSYFSPPHGLIVASNGSAESNDGTGDGEFSSELLNLQPE